MAGRKVRDEHEARALLEGLTASGMSLASWAHAQGVDGRSLNAWQLNLERRERHDKVELRLVELVTGEPPKSCSRLTVRCGPFTVEVPVDVDDQQLARVLATVAAC